jgi:hypothetical protein
VQSDWAVPLPLVPDPPLAPDPLLLGPVGPLDAAAGSEVADVLAGEEAVVSAGAPETAVVAPPLEGDDADVLDGLHPVARSAAAATADRTNDVRRVRGPILIKKTSSK